MDALLQVVRAELDVAVSAQKQTAAGATHEESRAENDKDTRGLEATYLARGLAGRVEELRDVCTRLERLVVRDFAPQDPIALGALVTVAEGEREHRYFVVPAGGGRVIELGDVTLTTVNSRSPLGRALIGKRGDDEVDVRTPQSVRELEIIDVA